MVTSKVWVCSRTARLFSTKSYNEFRCTASHIPKSSGWNFNWLTTETTVLPVLFESWSRSFRYPLLQTYFKGIIKLQKLSSFRGLIFPWVWKFSTPSQCCSRSFLSTFLQYVLSSHETIFWRVIWTSGIFKLFSAQTG